MRGMTVTGIINASNVAETAVWPKMKQPFMLFFAKNAASPPKHSFYFATLVRERRLNDRGLFRIDYQAAQPVAASFVVEKPWLLKALAIGTSLDVDVMDALESLGWETIGALWRPPHLYSGEGYNLSPKRKQRSASHLFKLPDFKEPEHGFCIAFGELKTWHENHRRDTAHFPRDKRLYAPPLLIVPQTPGEGRDHPRSYMSRQTAICFSKSYYGFSAAGRSEGEVLASLLYLITHSLLFHYFCLMVSSRFGAERRTFIKVDLESFPFPDPEELDPAQKHRILDLADRLETQTPKPWEEIDNFIFNLYGLDEDDATVVRDTLAVGAPYKSVRGPAEQPAKQPEAATFRSYLEDMLQPAFEIAGQRVHVELLPAAKGEWDPLWRFLGITLQGDKLPAAEALIGSLMDLANRAAASRVVMRVPEGGLLLGILNQRRFWTMSRARLCGVYLMRHHLDAFPLEDQK